MSTKNKLAKCIDNENVTEQLNMHENYEVLEENEVFYLINAEDGSRIFAHKERFEIIS